MKRILITGGSGFIGTNLVQRHIEEQCEVLNLDKVAPRNSAHVSVWKEMDILHREALLETVRDFAPDCVFHLAARTDLNGSSPSDYAANSAGTANLIEALTAVRQLHRVIFASSMLVCRIGYCPVGTEDYCPSTEYGRSKVLMERIIRARADVLRSWVIVRPTSIWGPWFDVPYKKFFSAVAKGIYLHPGRHGVVRSFGYVGNTVYQLCKLMAASDADVNKRLFYLTDYDPLEVRVWAELIAAATGRKRIRTVPIHMLRILAKIGDLIKKSGISNPPLTTFRLNNLTTNAVYPSETLNDVAGPIPFSVQEGIVRTLRWMSDRGEL